MNLSVAVIIPCFRVKAHILNVLARMPQEVDAIYVVDDACPEGSGDWVTKKSSDARVKVIRHDRNLGVGGAVMTGYAAALQDGAQVLVKVDGDGQMAPELIPKFTRPILMGQADYTKGNRFYDVSQLSQMPLIRLLGNAGLSFMAKLSTGYWNLFDTTNGFTALHAKVAHRIAFEKISERYFFETDLLFRLATIRAVVIDIPMDAKYGEEKSNLRIGQVLFEFFYKNLRNFVKRVMYNYFLRDMTVASLELLFGTALLAFGVIFGVLHWAQSISSGLVTPVGTVMLATLPTLLGLQFLLAFVAFDVANVPRRPIHVDLAD